jgi:hypothetical protein
VYARTATQADQTWPPADAMAVHPTCHVLAPDFWERYERARAGGVFYFWGHSYELIGDAMWAALERKIERISRDPAAQWDDVARLFTELGSRQRMSFVASYETIATKLAECSSMEDRHPGSAENFLKLCLAKYFSAV